MPTGGQQGAREFSGARMRAVREQANMSRAQLSARIGVAESTLGSYEGGRREPAPQRLAVLAKGLKVTPADLLAPARVGDDTLRQLRVVKGLRQADVAQRAGMRRTSYADLERGEVASLSEGDCDALARVFGVGQRVVRAAQAASRAAYLEQLPDR
jgi:transcriptional regulator with XRE-family HTH domain